MELSVVSGFSFVLLQGVYSVLRRTEHCDIEFQTQTLQALLPFAEKIAPCQFEWEIRAHNVRHARPGVHDVRDQRVEVTERGGQRCCTAELDDHKV
jgi:hypothetical protein